MATTQPRAWGAYSGMPYGSFAGRVAYAPAATPRIRGGAYYIPGSIPATAEPWIMRELQSVSRATFGAYTSVQLSDTTVEPPKREDGMMIFTNATAWNPGSGGGVYVYRSGAWRFLG